MSLFIPSEKSATEIENLFPFLHQLKESEANIGDGQGRVTSIYQLLELLCLDGRLSRKTFYGNVCCLDVGNVAPEVEVFKVFQPQSLTIAEGRQNSSDKNIISVPKNALSALRDSRPNSFNLVTMLNAFCDSFDTPESRVDFLQALNRVMKKGGNFVLSSDAGKIHVSIIQALEQLVMGGKVCPDLDITLPDNQREPMFGRGWVMRSILIENVLGVNLDRSMDI